MNAKKKKIVKRLSIIFSIVAIIIIYIYIKPVKYVVNLIAVSFLLAYTLRPLRDYICDKTRLKCSTVAIILILFTLFCFVALLYSIIPAIVKESGNLGRILDSVELYSLNLAKKFEVDKLPIFQEVYKQVAEKINVIFNSTSANLVDKAINIMGDLVGLAIVPIIAYYFLSDGKMLYNRFLLIFPTDKRVIIKNINNHVDKVLSRYIISQLVLSLIIAVLTFVLLIIINVKFSLILSVINGITNIIPYFGPIIGAIPIVFIAFTISPSKGLMALIGIVIIQQVEGNLLAPKITGDSTNMHPITIIILLIIGEQIAGVVGLILIVPIAVIIKVVYEDFNYYLF